MKALTTLRSVVRGPVHLPGDPGFVIMKIVCYLSLRHFIL